MKRIREVKRRKSGERNGDLYLALELGNTKWKLAFSGGETWANSIPGNM
jgi:hypothetical protein